MKTVQKLEIVAGMATLVSTLTFFVVFMLPLIKFNYDMYGARDSLFVLFRAALLVVLPVILTAAGAYRWAVKGGSIGFAVAITGSAIVSVVFGISH